MRLPINEYLYSVIKDFVAGGAEISNPETEDPAFARVWPDIKHFHRQTEELSNTGHPQFVAIFYDEDDKNRVENLKVPIQAPDLDNVANSYSEMVELAARSGLQLQRVKDNQELQTIFVDRLSEFMAQIFVSRALTVGGGMVVSQANTIVESNRSNDTVLYAKGFFFASTGQAFGISNPAEAYLFPARYTFGIMDSGLPHFDPVIWSCPTRVRLNLP